MALGERPKVVLHHQELHGTFLDLGGVVTRMALRMRCVPCSFPRVFHKNVFSNPVEHLAQLSRAPLVHSGIGTHLVDDPSWADIGALSSLLHEPLNKAREDVPTNLFFNEAHMPCGAKTIKPGGERGTQMTLSCFNPKTET